MNINRTNSMLAFRQNENGLSTENLLKSTVRYNEEIQKKAENKGLAVGCPPSTADDIYKPTVVTEVYRKDYWIDPKGGYLKSKEALLGRGVQLKHLGSGAEYTRQSHTFSKGVKMPNDLVGITTPDMLEVVKDGSNTILSLPPGPPLSQNDDPCIN